MFTFIQRPLPSGELVRDFADLVRRYAQEPGVKGRSGDEGSSGAKERAACVGIGVNCTDPDHVAGALRTLSAAIAEPYSCDRGARSIAAAVAAAAGATADAAATAATATASRSGDDSTTTTQEEKTPTVMGSAAAAPHNNGGKPPQLLLVAYPNSGETWDASARDWVEGTGLRGGGGVGGVGGAETFGRMARDEWYTAGSAARVFGGCCRTRPAHITEIRRALSALVSSQDRAALPQDS